jgi:hypothetical protein
MQHLIYQLKYLINSILPTYKPHHSSKDVGEAMKRYIGVIWAWEHESASFSPEALDGQKHWYGSLHARWCFVKKHQRCIPFVKV